VKQKGRGERGRVKVIKYVTDGEYEGRYKVTYVSDGSTCHVRPARMYKIYGGKSVVICYSTNEYRVLAQSQPGPDDFVIDIGCSYGHATTLLAGRARDALGEQR